MISVCVPATSANCCVGFDCLGMAVDWWAHFTFEESDTLIVEGCPDEFKGKNNLVVQAFYTTCDYLHLEYPTFKLTIDTDVPFARGLGSSSTCVVAGILACDAWFKKGMDKMEILKIATSIEGHPDNVAPAIFGQATACFMEREDVKMSLVPCANYHCLAIVPRYEVKTSQARKVLPTGMAFKGKNNLVVQAFYTTCDYLHLEYPTFKLTIDTDVPFARGLGSSSTCVVAGILACDAWFKKGMDKMEILKIATSIEGHPDNVAPAIFGQATACFMEREDVKMSLVPCANYHCLAIVPRYEVKTSQARKVLPTGMAFKDCVSQVSHALVFIQALQQGNESLLASSCRDLLHEPYRRQFIKEYDRIKKYCDLKQLPMWISGSGSTMMVVSLEKSHLVELSKILESCFSELDYRFLTIAKEGAFIKYE